MKPQFPSIFSGRQEIMDMLNPAGHGPVQLEQGSQDHRIVRAAKSDPVIEGSVRELIDTQRFKTAIGDKKLYLARTTFLYLATGAAAGVAFTTPVIPIPYKSCVLKKVQASMLYSNSAAGYNQFVACDLHIISSGQADLTQVTWTPTVPGTISNNNIAQARRLFMQVPGNSTPAAAGFASSNEPVDVMPYKFFQEGYSLAVTMANNFPMSLNDAAQFECDLLFEVIET
jgi:hypothetical protein